MGKMSRGLLIALALAAVPAGFLAANAAREGGWQQSPETRQRLNDGRIAAAKAALKLDAEQEKLWAPVETEIRANYSSRAEKRAERMKMREERRAARAEGKDKDDARSERPRRNVAERYERMAKRLGERADRMKAFSAAFTPFYASLSEEQKAVVGPVMRELKFMGGRRGHGARWAKWGSRGGDGRGWDRDDRGPRDESEPKQ